MVSPELSSRVLESRQIEKTVFGVVLVRTGSDSDPVSTGSIQPGRGSDRAEASGTLIRRLQDPSVSPSLVHLQFD